MDIQTLPIDGLQHAASDKLVAEGGGVVWWKPGEGKTRVAIAAFLKWTAMHQDVTSQLLTFCPPKAIFDWHQEAQIMGTNRVIPMSYGMLSSETALESLTYMLKMLRSEVSGVCFDEAYLYKNPQSNRTYNAHRIAKRYRFAVGLSGSVMTAQDITDVFGQFYAINKHGRIAPSLTRFRTEYMVGINEHGGKKFFPKRGSYARLMETVAPCAHIHMPKSTRRIHEKVIPVDVTSQQRKHFDELRTTLSVSAHGINLSSMASLAIKVQQVADGMLRTPEGTVVVIESNKPAALFENLASVLDAGERAVVWCAFRHEVEMLADLCPVPCLTLLGGEPFDVDTWTKHPKKAQVCFATEASGVSFNHFAQIQYAFYYSLSQSWFHLQQSMGRTERKSSQHEDCFYGFFHVAESMDEAILRSVRQAGSQEGALLKIGAAFQQWLGIPEEKNTGLPTEM